MQGALTSSQGTLATTTGISNTSSTIIIQQNSVDDELGTGVANGMGFDRDQVSGDSKMKIDFDGNKIYPRD